MRLHFVSHCCVTWEFPVQVTCFGGRDSNDFWIIHPSHEGRARMQRFEGKPVPFGAVVRLFHVNTMHYLHSHGTRAHVNDSQFEVCGDE